MGVQIPLERIEVPAGNHILLRDVSWEDFEAILEELGDAKQFLLRGNFQNEAIVRGRVDINLTQEPSPDLALDIDNASKSLERFPIYTRLGIPELWCYDAGTLTIYYLQNGQYVEAEQSTIFPKLNIRALPQLIEQNRSAGQLTLRRSVRAWVREEVL